MCQKEKKSSNMKNYLELFGAVVALVTLVIGVYQYSTAQHWKRSEFASQQVEKIYSDPLLSIASRALEWRAREFKLPDNYKLSSNNGYFQHDPNIFAESLKPESIKKEFTDNEILYLDVFDHFFDYLERINHYLEIDLFDVEDIEPICYRALLIEESKYVDKDVIIRYLKHYDYADVTELIQKCKP
jgi:hypothetical protein